MNSSRHVIESKVNSFISDFIQENKKDPTYADLAKEFKFKTHYLGMGAIILNLDEKQDILQSINNEGIINPKELIESYINYEKWFNAFIPKNLKVAYCLWLMDKDSKGFGAEIIDDLLDNDNYPEKVKQLGTSLSEKIHIELSKINFSENCLNQIQTNLTSLENVNFRDQNQEQLYKYFQLMTFHATTDTHTIELGSFLTNLPEPRPEEDGNVFAYGVLSAESVFFKIDFSRFMEVWNKFKNPKSKFSKEKMLEIANDALYSFDLDKMKTVALFFHPDSIWIESIAKGLEFAPKILELLRNPERPDNLIKERSKAFEESGLDYIEDFFINALSESLTAVFTKKNLDTDVLTSSFYHNQYINFINEYINRSQMLNQDDQKTLAKYKDDKKNKDTMIFTMVSDISIFKGKDKFFPR